MNKSEPVLIALLDTVQAAEFLGVSAYSLKLSRCTGSLCGVASPTYKKIGRLVRYEPAVIMQWLAQFEPQHNTGVTR